MAKATEIKILKKLSFPQNEPIYREGDISEEVFLIQDGTVEIFKLNADGREERVKLMTTGFAFGEQALISSDERKESARAMTDVKCVAVNRRNLDKQLDREDPFVAALFRIMQSNMQSVTQIGKVDKKKMAELAEMLTVTEDEATDADDDLPEFLEDDPFV